MWTLHELAGMKKAHLTGSPFKLHYRTKFQGIPISIENRKGSKRTWGKKPGEHTIMTHPYGYVRGSMGYDGDEVNVYIGPDKKSELVFIVNQLQIRNRNKFDEHKVMLGFENLAAAKKGYLAHFDKVGPKLISSIRMWTISRFKKWLERHGAEKGPVRKSLGELGELVFPELLLKGGGPFIGPKGGKWADAKHTIAWKDDHHAEATEEGAHFATGKSVVAKVTHRRQKTAKFGAQYGQDIEPHGRYVVHGHLGKPGKTVEPGGHKVETIHDTVHFKNPLVIQHKGTGSEPGMWKRRLSDEHGGKKGKALSRALAKKGHDAIVTVDKYGTSEIVDLTSFRKSEAPELLVKGLFIGPRGGKWKDAKHTVPYDEPHAKVLFHSAPEHGMESIQEHGLVPRSGAGLFEHGGYSQHSQGKVFLSDNFSAAKEWHGKVEDMLETRDEDESWKHGAVMLRVKHRRTSRDEIGDDDVSGSRVTKKTVPPEHIEYHDKEHGWRPLHTWSEGRHSELEYGEDKAAHAPGREAHRLKATDGARAVEQAASKKRQSSARAAADDSVRAHLAEHGHWQSKSSADREAKAKEVGKKGPLGLRIPFEWQASLQVDSQGTAVENSKHHPNALVSVKSHAVKKSSFYVPLVKAGPPAGYSAIPGGRKGGYRKRKGKSWVYWYPQVEAAKLKKPTFLWGESKWSEAELAAGSFDKDAAHWQGYQKMKDRPPIGWTQGGVVPSSKHPVKEAGLPHRLFQIISANADKGWAKLRDVKTGEERLVEHNRILPVFHQVRKAKPKSKGSDKPSPPWTPGEQPPPARASGASSKAKKIPAFADSRAKTGTGLAAIEGGIFLRHGERVYEPDESGNSVRIERSKTHVDDQTKTKLLAEFGPMISKTAMEVKKKFGLKSRFTVQPGKRRVDETLAELRMSAIEGMLTAMERYQGAMPFAPFAKMYAKDFARLHAAKEFSGGISIPKMHARLLSKYMAARAQASIGEGTMEPGPELVAKYWDVKKRDLHSGMEKDDPQRSEPVPMGTYKLKVKVRVGGKKETEATDTKHQPGKLEWAERMHSFLTGQATAQGSEFFEDSSLVFPGVHMGAGLSARDKVEIRESIGKILPKLREHEITIQSGRQSSTYKTDSGAILSLRLGLDGSEGMSTERVAAEVSIQKKLKDGWRELGHRQKKDLVQTFLERALVTVREGMGEGPGKALVGRAKERVAPEEVVRSGMTWRQELTHRMRSVPVERVRGWRKQERDRLRRIRKKMLDRAAEMKESPRREHQEQLAQGITGALRRIDRMGNREVAMKVVQSDLGKMTKQTREMQLATVEMEGTSPGYDYGWTVVTMTDPHSGRQRRMRMRTMKKQTGTPTGQPLQKADEPLSTGVVHDMLRWPRLTALLYGRESIPTVERFALETMVGLH